MAKIATLIDDFQDGVIDVAKWSTFGTVAETGGRARLTPSTGGAFLASVATNYDLTNSQITIHVPVITSNGSTGTLQSGIAIEEDVNNRVLMRKYGSDLQCRVRVGGVETNVSITLYNSVNHLFWRIRTDASNIYWETSATGSGAFFIQHTMNIASLGFSISSVLVYFYSIYTGVEPFPGTFQIESVNPGLPIAASGSSTSTGSLAFAIVGPVQMTFSGASTSTGSLNFLTVSPLDLTGSAASTSTGSLSFTLILAANLPLAASGASTSTGSFSYSVPGELTASAQSTSSGSLSFLTTLGSDFYYFEPPIAYDLPPTLPEPTRPRYINAHAKWKGGQRRGRTVLKYTTTSLYPLIDLFPEVDLYPLSEAGTVVYVTVDTPTVDQMAAADFAYQGGHIYTVSNEEAENLINAGYAIGAPA